VRLEFMDPGGAVTGRLLPTGNVADTLDIPGHGPIEASMVDAANPCVFIAAADLGLTGAEMPADLDARDDVMAWLQDDRSPRGATTCTVPQSFKASYAARNPGASYPSSLVSIIIIVVSQGSDNVPAVKSISTICRPGSGNCTF